MLIENVVFCVHCTDTVSSKNKYHISTCSCGRTIVGGGLENPVIEGDEYVDMSWSLEDKVVAQCLAAVGGATNRKEVLFAILGALRDAGKIIAEGESKVIAMRDDYIMVETGDDLSIYVKEKDDE